MIGMVRSPDLDRDGFVILPAVLAPAEIKSLIEALSELAGDEVRNRGGVYAIRNLLELSPAVRDLASSPQILAIANANGPDPFPVRATLFDKIAGANWLVPWHQDLTICVAERHDTPGYGPWTRKAGVWHVQPPAQVLENILSVRIHLDDCAESNGALRVLPGTHRLGRLAATRIAEEHRSRPSLACAARAGDVLLMRPLLLHASFRRRCGRTPAGGPYRLRFRFARRPPAMGSAEMYSFVLDR